jgi:threonyl-tRNA synthetase
VAAKLREKDIRVEVDESDDRMQKKIRSAQRQKVPFMLIAGATDAEAGAVSFRYRDGSQRNGIPVAQAIEEIADTVARRVNTSPTAELYESDYVISEQP